MTPVDSPQTTASAADSKQVSDSLVIRRRHPERWIGVGLVVLAVAWITIQLITNEAFGWKVVGEYFLSQPILDGVVATIYLTALAMIVGIALGTVLAIMRLSENPIVSGTSWVYVWFFRGTPTLVQLVFWFNLAALYPVIGFGLPFGGPKLFEVGANQVITSFAAALLGLGLNQAAYMGEIIRAGILGVDEGQQLASMALGMTPLKAMRRIILPQAMRMIVPPTANQTIGMLKLTSLASVVAFGELLLSAQTIYNRTFQTIPLLIVASIWYLILTTVLSIGQYYLERHYGRGSASRQSSTSLFQRASELLGVRRTPSVGGPT